MDHHPVLEQTGDAIKEFIYLTNVSKVILMHSKTQEPLTLGISREIALIQPQIL